MSDNMKIWDQVCETDPAHTKKVTFGRGFTAIDPMCQIRRATEVFGAAGEGWGWNIGDPTFLPTNEVCVIVTLWHGENERSVSQFGQASLFMDKAEKMKDTDCMKKAATDGLTKCLSYLGFNADVFLGKFDDNKYVQEMTEKHAVYEPTEEDKRFINDICHLIKSCGGEQDLTSLFDEFGEGITALDESLHDAINSTAMEVKAMWKAGNKMQTNVYKFNNIQHAWDSFIDMGKTLNSFTKLSDMEEYSARWSKKIMALSTELSANKYKEKLGGVTPYEKIEALIDKKIKEFNKGE